MRDPLTLDRIIKALSGKLLDGTITSREQTELEYAQADRRGSLVKILPLPPRQKKRRWE